MRIREAIDKVDAIKPNAFSIEDKVRWLSYVDGHIKNETIDSHMEEEPTSPLIIFPEEDEEILDVPEDVNTRYTTDDLDVQLLAPYPYDELYVAYLKMKIDEENGETQRYNNSATMYNAYYDEYIKAYNKDHKPIRADMKYRR